VLTFKNREATQDPLAAIPTADLTKSKTGKSCKNQETIHWCEPIFIKTKYWSTCYRRKEINVGDTIMIKGMTTGEQQWSLRRCK
jgi:UPF0176 protein